MAWNLLEIGKAFVVPLITAGLTTAGIILTSAFGYWNKDRSQDIEMVNIALSILSGEKKDNSVPGRKFALRLLEEYSAIDIPEDEFESWAEDGTLPETIYRAPTKSSWNLKSGGSVSYDADERKISINGKIRERDPFLIDPYAPVIIENQKQIDEIVKQIHERIQAEDERKKLQEKNFENEE